MNNSSFQGVYAALLTPRSAAGSLDETAFCRLLDFQLASGIRQFAINGATGEFCCSTEREVKHLCMLVAEVAGREARFVCGAGSSSLWQSRALLEVAAECGAQAGLLATPYFFPYEQEDVAAWFRELAGISRVPVLLYNLPQFTTSIEVGTALQLLREGSNVIGVKDSSGSLNMLEAITRDGLPVARIVGNDSALIGARRENLCDAVISGVACVMPELITAVFNDAHDAANCDQLGKVLADLAPFPTPWGLKWMAEAQGIMPATFAQAVSESRRTQGKSLLSSSMISS